MKRIIYAFIGAVACLLLTACSEPEPDPVLVTKISPQETYFRDVKAGSEIEIKLSFEPQDAINKDAYQVETTDGIVFKKKEGNTVFVVANATGDVTISIGKVSAKVHIEVVQEPEVPKYTPGVDFLFTFECPDDLYEHGAIIVSYKDIDGYDVRKELSVSDFLLQGTKYGLEIGNEKPLTVSDGKMVWQTAMHFDNFDIHQHFKVQYNHKKNASFSYDYQIRARTVGEDGFIIDSYQYPQAFTINIYNATVINIGTPGENVINDLQAKGLYIANDGKISEEEIQLVTEEQHKYITECVGRLVGQIIGKWNEIAVENSDGENTRFQFAETAPEWFMKDPVEFGIEILKYSEGDVFLSSTIKVGEASRVGQGLGYYENLEEFKEALNSSDLYEAAVKGFEKLVDKQKNQ